MSASGATPAEPWLSVIIPTFNGERTIAEALASVSAQNDCGLEVLVVDDGSTDATLSIVRSYDHLANLRILPRDHTGNWVANTNRGIEESRGQYLSILHQDDRWERRRLAALRAVLAEHPGVQMCFHPSFFIGPDGSVVGLWRCPFAGRRPQLIAPEVFLRRLLVQNFIAIPAPLFRKDSALKVGMLDESLVYTADWDFWIKLTSLGLSAYVPEPLTSFRVHPQSQTAALSRNAELMEQQLSCVLQRHFGRCQASARDRQRLLKVATFSIRTNVAFMRLSNAQSPQWFPLLVGFLGLGPRGWWQFFRCSRIVDRTLARLRVRRRARVGQRPAESRAENNRVLSVEVNDPAYAESLLTTQNKWWKRLLNVQWPYRAFLRSLGLGLTLDVGCGVGRNLKTLGDKGVGVDPNETAVRLARQQGCQAFTPEDFRRSEWAVEGRFDSLLCAHVLEHLKRPDAIETLATWLPFLKPQGRLVLIVPQEKGFQADRTHLTFLDGEDLAQICESLQVRVVRKCSFPFPRFMGRFFTYNESVVLALKGQEARAGGG